MNDYFPKSALAIGAHPDDIEFNAGGTLSKWASLGTKIFFGVLTDGSKGSWEQNIDQIDLIRLRKTEQLNSAKLFQAHEVLFLDAIDGELEESRENVKEICKWIREIKPEVVLTHDPWKRYRLHPDHRVAGWLVISAIVAARDHLFYRDLNLAPFRPELLFLFEADEPDHFEDISQSIDIKISALLEHKSQHVSTMDIKANNDLNSEIKKFSDWVKHIALENSDRRYPCESFKKLSHL